MKALAAVLLLVSLGFAEDPIKFRGAYSRQRTDWLPPTPPMGGGWTRDGHLQAVTATPEAVHIWLVQ